MQFSVGKCSIMSAGRTNSVYNYCLNDTSLSRSMCWRDLGVLVNCDLRPRALCVQARSRANRVVGFISRSVSKRNVEVILKLYFALMRPRLDYAVHIWSLDYKMDINMLESVYRKG